MASHGCIHMVWFNNFQDSTGTPCNARTGIIQTPHGNLQCFSHSTGPVRGPCMIRKGAVWCPYGHIRELTQPDLEKIHGRRIWPYGAHMDPLRSPHRLFIGCLWSPNPCRACKHIMHALKLYGPHKGRQNSYGQPVNSPGTARTGPASVMWLRHKRLSKQSWRWWFETP